MNILLTNDDGINSPGLRLLASALRKEGHRVLALAPESDRSGFSHAISFINMPCKLTEIERDTWSCSGTPADCAALVLMGALPQLSISRPDLVISGINRGANLGTDLIYSGTAAAARQAGMFGIPSLAVSLVQGENWYWDMAVSFVTERLEEMRNYWKVETFVNVNIPNRPQPPDSLIPAFPAHRRYNDSVEQYIAPRGEVYCFVRFGKVITQPEKNSDSDVINGNNASISAVFIHPVSAEVNNGR